MQRTPASARSVGPSANGKNASLAATGTAPAALASLAFAFSTAFRQLATRSICPAPAPQRVPPAPMHTAFDLRCLATANISAASASVSVLGAGPAATVNFAASIACTSRSCTSMPPGTLRHARPALGAAPSSPVARSRAFFQRACSVSSAFGS